MITGFDVLGFYSSGIIFNFLNSSVGKIIFPILSFSIYIYFALAFMTIAKKLKYDKPWLAWIPIANFAMILSLGGFYWAWVFLIFIPLFGWIALIILGIIAQWRIFEKRNYPGWLIILSLAPFGIGYVIYLVEIGLVAWKERKPKKYLNK
ncbi:MAG: hypothetical protein ABIH49_00090 [archaeon]